MSETATTVFLIYVAILLSPALFAFYALSEKSTKNKQKSKKLHSKQKSFLNF